MDEKIKSGKEVLDDFFNTFKGIPGVDEDVADVLLTLYQSKKLSARNLSNALSKMREGQANDED